MIIIKNKFQGTSNKSQIMLKLKFQKLNFSVLILKFEN